MVGKKGTKVRKTREIAPVLYKYFRSNNIRVAHTKEIYLYLGNEMRLTEEEKVRVYPHKRSSGTITYLNCFENDCRTAKDILSREPYEMFKRLGNTKEGRGKWMLSDLSWEELDQRFEVFNRLKRIKSQEWRKHPIPADVLRKELMNIMKINKIMKRSELLEKLLEKFELNANEADAELFKRDFKVDGLNFLRSHGNLKEERANTMGKGYVELI